MLTLTTIFTAFLNVYFKTTHKLWNCFRPSFNLYILCETEWNGTFLFYLAPCSFLSIDHGRVTNYAKEAKVPHDKHIAVDCVAQYELRYNNTPATCNNGSWTHIPTCIPGECRKFSKFIPQSNNTNILILLICFLKYYSL